MQFGIIAPLSQANAVTKAEEKSSYSKAISAINNKEWGNALNQLKVINDPLFQKLVTWVYLKESKSPSFKATRQFISRNPNWPHLGSLKLQAERNISKNLPPYEVVNWFDENIPTTAKGAIRYIDALLTLGHKEKATEKIRKFWKTANLSRDETHQIAKKYPSLFLKKDHIERLDRLIWRGRYKEAQAMLWLVPKDIAALHKARLYLAQKKPGVDKAIAQVPKHLKNDPALTFERLRWRRKSGFDSRAIEVLFNPPKNLSHEDKWWKERHIMIRRAIEDNNYARAYALASRHVQKSGLPFAQAEFLSGWLSLQHLNKPKQAFDHFYKLHKNVKSPISLARATYWLGRAAEDLHQKPIADKWYLASSRYTPTFYGQLASAKLPPQPFKKAVITPNLQQTQTFNRLEMVRIIRLINQTGLDKKVANPFFSKLFSGAKTPHDYKLVTNLALEIGQNQHAVLASKKLFYKHQSLMLEGYPLLKLNLTDKNKAALAFGIIRQESLFNAHATSPVGARGLMQLMTGTAKDMARKTGQKFQKSRLYQAQYNTSLGTAYLQYLDDRFDGSTVLIIASYNAGPGRVNSWLKKIGDPRSKDINIIDWVESIPVYETRNYVQRVLEGMYIYQLRLSMTPQTIMALK